MNHLGLSGTSRRTSNIGLRWRIARNPAVGDFKFTIGDNRGFTTAFIG
jgi:hypothetical protein